MKSVIDKGIQLGNININLNVTKNDEKSAEKGQNNTEIPLQ